VPADMWVSGVFEQSRTLLKRSHMCWASVFGTGGTDSSDELPGAFGCPPPLPLLSTPAPPGHAQ